MDVLYWLKINHMATNPAKFQIMFLGRNEQIPEFIIDNIIISATYIATATATATTATEAASNVNIHFPSLLQKVRLLSEGKSLQTSSKQLL